MITSAYPSTIQVSAINVKIDQNSLDCTIVALYQDKKPIQTSSSPSDQSAEAAVAYH